jgi:hypothetical protein
MGSKRLSIKDESVIIVITTVRRFFFNQQKKAFPLQGKPFLLV